MIYRSFSLYCAFCTSIMLAGSLEFLREGQTVQGMCALVFTAFYIAGVEKEEDN